MLIPILLNSILFFVISVILLLLLDNSNILNKFEFKEIKLSGSVLTIVS